MICVGDEIKKKIPTFQHLKTPLILLSSLLFLIKIVKYITHYHLTL